MVVSALRDGIGIASVRQGDSNGYPQHFISEEVLQIIHTEKLSFSGLQTIKRTYTVPSMALKPLLNGAKIFLD